MTTTAPSATRVELVLRQADYWRTVYRRTWKGSVITSFVQPLFYVAAMGLLLGDYIDDGGAALEGAPSYLAFIAPGLLAAQAMQIASGETLWPVMGAVKWNKTYHGMIATPLRVSDVIAAHLLFVLFRIASSCAVFALVLAPFDVYSSVGGALVAYLASVLVGMAFAAPIYAFAAGATTEQWFAFIMRLIVMPLFLFSGAFFPIGNLDPWMEGLARITPLWHGVDLARMATLGNLDGSAVLGHVAYLVLLCAVGCWWAGRRLTRRLVT
ncbi:MAG TPA: ABC transporter permease [Nocardioidaceae bacterium]|nr:ABC transporter permease [Nocardioidaceae bacterium]